MIFVLDKKERVINTLKNNYSGNSANPYFNDVLMQDLATGAESYSFSTFAKGTITNDLVIGNYIAFKYKNSYKLFQITNVEITHEETMEISVYSECAGLSLLNNVFRKRTMTSCTLRKFIDAIVENTDWNTGLIEEAVNSVDLDIDTNTCYTVLQENIKEFGVELEFRVEINHGRVSKKYIDTYKQRGKVTGKRFVYGRDIEKVVKTVNSEQLYTALVGEGKNGESFRDITVSGIDKPLGQDFVADQESYEKYNRNGYHLMGVYTVDSDVPEVILRKTYEKLQEVKNPKISYEIPVIMLGELLGLEWDKVSIGDQIGILDTEFNPPLMLSARVSNLQISKSNPESSTCTLSNFIEVSSNITDEMRKIASKLEGYVDNKFPIGSDEIQEGAVNGTHMDKQYVTQITADIVQASTVKAEEVITDRITALNGRFETIEADSIKAKEIATEALNAGSVTAGRVDAVEGNFKTLSSDVATINTLVNGNLSSDNIQAGGITGDRLNMETIFVSNANIIDVNASKINAGEINTNKVHIQSANGGIVIADNTQQFKDKNGKVRIQMGQDATGNFTFGVFDSTGTGVLIDATGVKEKALADGIIKDRMIGSGEISGQKINISSLISQINSDTNATSIKGTKVLLDTESQTLELAFSSLKKQADATKTATESNTTAISTANGSIQTLISNTTIVKDGQSLTLKDAYTATAQTVDSLKTTVGKHETKWTENEKFVSTVNSTLKQHSDSLNLKVESSYVEEVFENTIKSVDVQYYLSTSSSSLVGGSWSTNAPAWQKGKYIWTKTVTTYMSGLTQETTPVCISGVNGQDGQNGANGADGKGIKSIEEQYYLSTSTTTQAGGAWSTTVPTWTNGKYMWTRSVITYTDNSTTTTNPVCVSGSKGDKGDRGLQGLQGPKGDQGIPGNDGADGKTSYFHIKYSSVAKPTSSSQMTETPNTYIGTYVDYTATDSTDPTKYTWSRFEGLQGSKGDQGIPGTNGADGKTSYLHIKYSNDGGKTFTANNGEEPGDWIGQYTDFNVNDSTSVTAYTWSLIKGEAGVGISSVDVEYYLSTSATSLSGGEWSTTAPAWVNGKYMWSRTKTVNTTGTTTYSNPACITGAKGSTGATGATGKGVKSTTVTYQASTSGTTVPTGSWTTTIPTVSAGQYLWTRTIITYTDNTNTTSYSIGKMGEQGATGQNGTNGVGVKSTSVTYQASTSGTTTPTGTWSSTIPTVSAGQYLWTRTIITYTNGTSATSYSIGKMGEQGPTGATGVGIKSVENYYLASASASGVTTSTSGWTTTVQTINTTNKYLWNYEKITYTNNSTSNTDPVIIGVHGTNGTNGAAGKGISSITEYYLVSSAATGITTSTSGWTTKIPSMTTTNRYLWNYEVIKYTDNSTTTGTPKVIGVYGNTGATGATGQGVESITEEYYLSTSKTTQNGGEWTTTPPTWSTGKYIWTRSKIVYKNPSATAYTTPICDSSWEAVNEIQIGGRNLMANSKETDTFTAFTGGTNKTMFYRTVTLTPDIKEGDKITVSLTYKYKNIVLVSGQESNAKIYVQGSGNVTSWSPGFNSSANIVPSITKGSASELTYYQTYTFTLSASQVTNKTFSVGLRTDYIASGSLSVYEMKVEKGNKPTSWTPAPEDIDNTFTTLTQRVSSAELDLQKNSIIAKVQDTFTTKTESNALKNQLNQNAQNIRCNNLGAKINYSSFSYADVGEIYLHGYDSNNNPTDTNGSVYWNGATLSVPKGMINPNSDFGTGNDVYIFVNKTNTSVVMGGYYDTSAKAWKYKQLIGGTASGTFTPSLDHVALGMFNMKDAESFNFAFLFDNPQSLKNLTVGVADLITRMNTAEQKITSDAIVNTVKNHQTNGTNTFATSSELTQTAKNITASFKASGGYNLVKNSCFFNGLNGWSIDNIDSAGTSKSISYWTDSNQYILPNTNAVVIRGTNLTDRYGITQSVKIKRGQKYTVSALSASHRGNTIRITIRSGNGGGHLLNVTAGLANAGKDISRWNKMEGVFTAPTDSDYIIVCLYMDKSGSDSYVWFTQIMVNEGEVKQPWSPHPSEIYEGSTVIDASGVTIKNGALKVENNAGTTVLQGNTSGTLYLKDGGIVVAGTATDAWNNYGYRTTLKKNGIQFNWDASDSGGGNPPVSANVYLDYSRGQLVLSGGTKAPGIYVASGLEASSVTTPAVYTSNWFRSTGNTGWYSETYGGGWYMTDSTWIRNYGGKQVYINSLLRTDGGFHVGSGGSAFNVTPGGVVTSAGAINTNSGININSGNLVLGKANTEQQIYFSDCSSDNRNMYFYKGSSSSATRIGLYDKEAASAVWRYANDNTFVLERELIVKGHVVPHTTKSYWIGTNSPDKKWKGLCAEGGTVGASDIRNKENIERLDGTIVTYDEVSEEINEYQLANLRSNTRANSSDYYEFIKNRFKPSYYNYKLTEHINEDTDEFLINPEDEYNMLKNVGFIAQDYDLKNDKVAQEFIFENENGELSYNHMSYVTVGMIALQEAIKKIEHLEKENQSLKDEINKIKVHLGLI